MAQVLITMDFVYTKLRSYNHVTNQADDYSKALSQLLSKVEPGPVFLKKV